MNRRLSRTWHTASKRWPRAVSGVGLSKKRRPGRSMSSMRAADSALVKATVGRWPSSARTGTPRISSTLALTCSTAPVSHDTTIITPWGWTVPIRASGSSSCSQGAGRPLRMLARMLVIVDDPSSSCFARPAAAHRCGGGFHSRSGHEGALRHTPCPVTHHEQGGVAP